MARKKDFTQGGDPPTPITVLPAVDARRGIICTVTLPLPHGIERVYSYESQIGLGYDEVLSLCLQSVRQLIQIGRPEPESMRSTIESGLRYWLMFCQEQVIVRKEITAASVDKRFVEEFIGWLKIRLKPNGDKWSLNTARTTYSKMKVILDDLSARQLLPPSEQLFPVNPFPRATALESRRDYIHPLSDREREEIIKALAPEIGEIFDGTHPGSFRVQLCLCVFAILLKTGLNPTPLLEIPRDLSKAFMDHPRANRKILITTKRRASKDIATPVEETESRVVSLDVYRICERIGESTARLAALAGDAGIAQRLWLVETSTGGVRGINVEDLSQVSQSFTARHALRRDDGSKLKMTSQLFRNTKLNRIWRASKGDLLATAHSAGNTPAVAERYLAVTPDMLEEHRLAGEVLVETLLDAAGKNVSKTPVAGCRDPYKGELAPKNGKPCVDFLSCFRCKSQVITGDDLYRLFSFYWAILGERDRIGSKTWKKVFAWILRIIDRDISPKFDAELVEREKARARQTPHPMWRVPEVTLAIGSVQ